jgi:hypothetical protein
LVNNAINSVVATTAKRSASTNGGTTITHAYKQINYEALEKIGWRGTDTL